MMENSQENAIILNEEVLNEVQTQNNFTQTLIHESKDFNEQIDVKPMLKEKHNFGVLAKPNTINKETSLIINF